MYVKFINKQGKMEIIESVEKVIYKQDMNKFQIFATGRMEFYVNSYDFIDCYE